MTKNSPHWRAGTGKGNQRWLFPDLFSNEHGQHQAIARHAIAVQFMRFTEQLTITI